MEGETNSKQVLCISGCGFFGSPTTEDFCSICFKEAIRKKQQNEDSASIQAQTSIREAVDVAAIAIQPQTHSEEINESDKDENKNKNLFKTEEVAVAAIAIQPETLSEEQKDCDKVAKKKKNRCMMCRKKVGLTGFDCRCGGLFCGLHRYSDKHECSFNYREMGAEEIKRKNPVVVGEKIRKI